MAKNVLSNPGRALDSTAKIATAAVPPNSKQALSALPELITFIKRAKVFILEKLFRFLYIKWSKNVINYIPVHHWKILI